MPAETAKQNAWSEAGGRKILARDRRIIDGIASRTIRSEEGEGEQRRPVRGVEKDLFILQAQRFHGEDNCRL